MQCPQCRHENPENARFCNACGAKLEVVCSACEHVNPTGSLFCNACGHNLVGPPISPSTHLQPQPAIQVEAPPAEPQTPDAERRQLTVMFCDLADSTTLSSQLDPEDLREVIQSYQSSCDEVIQHFEGHIAQYLGDGVLVYFGYPRAHEDDAQRAIRAGLGLVDVLEELNRCLEHERGIQLTIRVGIHTGLVVVGPVGGASHHEQLALGETPNIAARLEGLARPNTVVISHATAQLVQGYFDWQALGEQPLRGIPDPIAIYQVLAESEARNRLDVASTLTPLIGREQEVRLLRDRFVQAQAGMGQVVIISGEAGIGKSRLIQALQDQIDKESVIRLECRSSPYYQHTPLTPIIDLLHRFLGWGRDEPPDTTLAKLESELNRYQLEVAGIVPLLATLLSLPLPDDRYPALQLTPPQQRQKTLEALLSIILAVAEQQPVLFILEDLHWIDPTTQEFLSLLIDQIPTAAMYLVLTCRPSFQAPWSSRSYLTQVTLNRLSQRDVEEMIDHVIDGKRLPDDVLRQLVEKTDGVPLFVEEMTKTLLESDRLRLVDTHYELTGSGATFSIPATLQDSLMDRLDRLVTAKAIAQLGATMGRQFSYELLQAVIQLDETRLHQELAQLVDAEIVYQRGLPPQSTYTFKHALIQDAAYQSLLKRTRQSYHQQIATLLADRFAQTPEAQSERLAYHTFQGELWDQAVTYFQQAGSQSMARSAYREAASCFDQAVAALEHLPESRETLEQGIDLRLDLRNALLPLGEEARIIDNLRTAETIAERLDDAQRLGQIALYLCIYFSTIDEHDRAIAAGQRALALGASIDAVDLQAVAQTYLGVVYSFEGDYRQALDFSRQAMALLTGELLYERLGQAALPALVSRGIGAWSLAELGTFAEGRRMAEDALRLAEAIAQPYNIASARRFVGLVYRRQGDFHQAIPALEQCLALSQNANISRFFPVIASTLGVAYASVGRNAEALPLLNQVLEHVATGNRLIFHALMLSELSEAVLLVGRVEEASALADHLYELSHTHSGRGYQAHACRLRGEVAMRRDSPKLDQAEPHYQQALALADKLGMRPLEAHCHRGLGMLYGQTGQAEQARTELSVATRMYRDMEMMFWLAQAEEAMSMLTA
ncbi:MAG: AAA family ATPase [Candidatus Tectomicrobia bacterium]|nr:AAA family ATPase [Candidatus Tectomicrobia bacterium]